MTDELSPTSIMRLHFDQLTPETDDPEKKMLFGVPMPPFVSDKVISWIEDGLTEPLIYFKGLDVLKKVC